MFLKIEGSDLVHSGEKVMLKGVNFGNWLLLEHFMIGVPYVDPEIQRGFCQVLGRETGKEFFRRYRETYITKDDFTYLKQLGANVIRLPFSYRLIEGDEEAGIEPGEGYQHLDRALRLAAEHEMYVLLDMHAAPGSQAVDWNAENLTGRAQLWEEAHYRRRTLEIWQEIARRYVDEPWLMGYEPINEPVAPNDQILQAFYRDAIRAIREVDRNHLIVLEGNMWGKDPKSLSDDLFEDPGVMIQPHHYAQQFHPFHLIHEYPTEAEGERIDRACVWNAMSKVVDDDRIGRPVLFGEFGLQYYRYPEQREAHLALYSDVLSLFEEYGYHWTIWTYKDVGAMGFVAPRADTPWKRFLAREDIVSMREKFARFCQWRHFPGRDESTMYRELHVIFPDMDEHLMSRQVREAQRDLEKIALHAVLEKLKDCGREEILAMAESFSFNQCEVLPPAEAMLKRYLA